MSDKVIQSESFQFSAAEQMAINEALIDKTDIVWRLRANWSYLGREAADEITRLRAQVRQLNADYAEEHTEIEAMLDSLGIARPNTDSMPDCAELSQVMKDEISRLRGRNHRNAQDLREYAAVLAGEMADMVADECKITVQRMV